MPRYSSDDAAEDVGRMDSERQIRNKPTSRWLDDVIKQADGDHAEMLATIEGHKERIDEMHDGFLGSLQKAIEVEERAGSGNCGREVQVLLSSGDELLRTYRRADEKIAKAFGDQSTLTVLQKNHEADVSSLKEVLLAGKRIAAGELEGVEQQARAKELMSKKDVLEQAKGIFGGPKKVEGDGLDKSLANVERGVRRMVKGMDMEM